MTRFNLKNKLSKSQRKYTCYQLPPWANHMIRERQIFMETQSKIIDKKLMSTQLSLLSIQLPNNHVFLVYRRVELHVISKLREILGMNVKRHSDRKRLDCSKKKLTVMKEPRFWDNIINNNRWRLQSQIITKNLYRMNINLKINGMWNREKKYSLIKMYSILKFILLPILQDFKWLISL